ncbi:hypothetical protein Vretimale_11575 [Volvox reticuliferus]|uniref:RING-type E3 ubiquitin transferase n=1 Tax=Volvox reticuliferus TaxID=1737510 RepID=A0A8J4FQY9_9CHLO|nr:hypothetical protein Vretifemale_14849 [Volvox reticuliferus]GIM07453.1 hypothetical protein Vretimale_11575 [Volvox reticuliferus]
MESIHQTSETARACNLSKKLDTNKRLPVALARLAEETRCPVCFGILKHTVTSTVCLHRFCALCIDRCLAGRPPQHKDCPVCRANLHSRRALRPDVNFDRLLRSLYGDVVVYGQEEDALVAARNRAHAAQAAEEHRLRQAQQCAAAAAAAGRPHFPRLASQPLGESPGGVTPAPDKLSRQTSSAMDTGMRGGVGSPIAAPVASAKRPRETHNGGHAGGSPAGELAAPRWKRHHSLPDPAAARDEPLMSTSPQVRSPCGTSREAGGTASLANAPVSSAGPPARPTCPHYARAPQLEVQSKPVKGAGGHGAVGVTANAAITAPKGNLAVPTARSASELSFRHPGMVVLRLQPGVSPGDSGGGTSASGRPLRAVVPPPLEKPFLLVPSKWTVAHIAQLLSQWIPARGFGHTNHVPPSAIHLEPSPGQLRGSHRCLRGCTVLGSLAAEQTQPGEKSGGSKRGGSGSGGGCNSSPLVLLYSIMQSS